MPLALTSAPALEPVTLDDVKAHLRIDGPQEDTLLASLILTSRLHLEAALDLAMIEQGWTLQLDRWPKGQSVDIPISPLQAVTLVRVKNDAGGWDAIGPANYLADIAAKPPRVIFHGAVRPVPGVPAAGIEITFTAGFGAAPASVPAPLRHAIMMLVAHWYEHRESVEIGSNAVRIPDAVSDLVAPFRKIRL